MKKILLSIALGVCSALCMGAKYTLVTSTDDLSSGDIIVIACNTKSVVAGALTGTNMPSVAATFADDKSYVTVTGGYEYTLTGSGTSWVLSNEDGKIGCTSNKNSLTTDDSADKYSSNWVIESIDAGTGKVKYLCKSNSYKNTYLQYNSSAKYFANYDSNQTAIQFYKKTVSSDPVIECVEAINFGKVLVVSGTGVAEQKLDIDAQNLTDAIDVTITAGSDNFTVDKTSVAATGGSIQVGVIADADGELNGTLQLKSGTAVATVTLQATGVVVSGDGTKDHPFSCADVIKLAFNDASQFGWVTGYILGSAQNGPAVAGTPNNTSLIIADDKTGTNQIAVALPDGAVRTALNVVDHPSYIGYVVKVYGALQNYYGGPGLKSTSQYELKDVPAGIESIRDSDAGCRKILHEGRVLIIREGVLYDMNGANARVP